MMYINKHGWCSQIYFSEPYSRYYNAADYVGVWQIVIWVKFSQLMFISQEGPELLSRQALQEIANYWYRQWQSPRRIQLPAKAEMRTWTETKMFLNK